MYSFLEELIGEMEDWDTDGFGDSSNLICPCGYSIEQEGECPDGCISPLLALGMV